MDDKTIKQTPVTGFPLPKLKPEGRTVCRWDCQYEELNKRNKQLETALREIELLHYDSETDFHHDAMKAHDIARAALEEKKDD